MSTGGGQTAIESSTGVQPNRFLASTCAGSQSGRICTPLAASSSSEFRKGEPYFLVRVKPPLTVKTITSYSQRAVIREERMAKKDEDAGSEKNDRANKSNLRL